MIGEEVLGLLNKKVVKILPFDMVGYDRGFMLEMDNGLCLELYPFVLTKRMSDNARISIKEVIQ